MATYRFFIWTDESDRMSAVEVADCTDDADAVHWAARALGANQSYAAIEVWKDDRFVGRRRRGDERRG